MSKVWEPKKKTVELQPAQRPSRIRRDPALADKPRTVARNAWWESREWEIRLAIVGIILFALSLTFLSVGFSEITSH